MTGLDYGDTERPVILVAEDSHTVQAMVSSRLERSGYDVLATDNGSDALRLAQERRPALVILDVEMPGMTGVEVTRMLRAENGTRDIPIILLTAFGEETDVAAGYAAGANDYITKPFSPQELQSRVLSLLGT
jgi:two-component system, OmpR family, phosphate regulon response regulator PhoB